MNQSWGWEVCPKGVKVGGKTLDIKIKDKKPIHQKYKANESTSRKNPKKK
jgi:hypothetical protein